jgi:hypothetical protein
MTITEPWAELGQTKKAIHGLSARPDRKANCQGGAHASMQCVHRLPMDNLPQGRGISILPAPFVLNA